MTGQDSSQERLADTHATVGPLQLVPTEQHVERASGEHGTTMTLRRLIARLLEPVAFERAPTTPEMTRLMTASLLGPRHALAPSVDNAIGALRRAGIGAQELAALRTSRARLFGDVIERADAWLATAGLRDERADAWLAASAVRADTAQLPEATSIRVTGLCRWDNATLCLLEALHAFQRRRGKAGVTVELPAPHALGDATAVEQVAKALETRWALATDSPALSFIEPARVDRENSPASLRVIAASSVHAEARAAVHSVLCALEAGANIDRIGLVALDLSEPFLEPLRAELARAKIPFTEPRGRPAVAAPHTHAALTLLKLARGPVVRDAVVDLLRTPDLSFRRWVGADARAQLRLARALEEVPLAIDRSGTDLLRMLSAHRDGAWACEAYARLSADLERGAAAAPRAALVQHWRELFDSVGILDTRPRTLADALFEADSGRPLLLHALSDDAYNRAALVEAMDRVVKASAALGLGVEPIGPGSFLEELQLALSGVGRARGAARAGALRVARPGELAGLDLELTVICGATAGNVDTSSAQTERLLGEPLLAALPQELRPPSSHDQQHFTELELAWLMIRAPHRIVSYSEYDTGGRPERACQWLRRLKITPEHEPASPLSPKARRVAATPNPSPEVLRRIAIERQRTAYFLDPQAAAGPHTGRAGPLQAWVGGASADRPVAVTRLESYARCAFLGFSSAVLRAARDEDADESIGYREAGRLLHEALARALSATRSMWATAASHIVRQAALDAAQSYLETTESSPLRRAGLAATLLDVAAFIDWSIENQLGFGFHEAEKGFGDGSEWTALEIDGTHFRGRIDRIDLDLPRRRLRIIDYKSGRLPSTAECASQLFQPWLYALKAADALSAREVLTGYLAKTNRAPSWKEVHSGSLEDPALVQAGQRAAAQLRSFWQGHIDPRPADSKYCPRCDARDICRRPPSAPDADEGNE